MIALTLLLGCGGEPSEGAWLETARYDWELFNHRMSYVEFGVDGSDAYASIVGGTSTTNIFTELDDGCEQPTCQEFPFIDFANIELGWAKVTSEDAVFGDASGEVLADADGETVTVTIPLSRKAKGEPTVLLRGYRLDTNEPLDGEVACYKPQNGWLPKRLGLELGTPVLSDDRKSVTVDLSAHFEAGLTREHERECLDAVVERARVRVWADVLAVVTQGESESFDVTHGMAYEFDGNSSDPPPQPDPDAAERPLDTTIADPVTGWSAFQFVFHEVGESRGAYVRSFGMELDAAANLASGHSTNFSPITQLSAFDYTFEGTAVAVDVGGGIERDVITEQIDVVLDDAGAPVGVRWSIE